MFHFRSLIYLVPQLWRALCNRPITVKYPFSPLKLPDCFRGRVTINADLCKGCGACMRDCPAHGLVVEKLSRDCFRVIHYPDRCAYCGQCESSCRTGAIALINEHVPATFKRTMLGQIMVERNSSGSKASPSQHLDLEIDQLDI